VQLNQKGKTKK